MSLPGVTLIVVPRERYSSARQALETLYAHTAYPFTLVYVDVKSPPSLRKYLALQAQEKGFQHLCLDQYIAPSQARNVGLRHATSEYVVFLDNDVLVSEGWLAALVQCAEETDASVVGPLYLQGTPQKQVVHMAGATCFIEEEGGRRIYHEEDRYSGLPRDALQALVREQTDLVEFHCMLARRQVFDEIGLLDEEIKSIRIHEDVCLRIREAGGTIFLEPQAVVTYLPPAVLAWSDRAYFRWRWRSASVASSLQRFHSKWRLDMDHHDVRYAWIERRRRRHLYVIPIRHFFTRRHHPPESLGAPYL